MAQCCLRHLCHKSKVYMYVLLFLIVHSVPWFTVHITVLELNLHIPGKSNPYLILQPGVGGGLVADETKRGAVCEIDADGGLMGRTTTVGVARMRLPFLVPCVVFEIDRFRGVEVR